VKQLLAAAEIANQQLAMDQIVGRGLTGGDETFEFADEGPRDPGETESKPMYRSKPLSCFSLGAGSFAPSWDVLRVGFRPRQGAEALIGRMAHQGLQAQADGLRIRACAAGRLGLLKELLIEIEGLLHTYNYAMYVWLPLLDAH
jgi:hypothetical protein